MRGSSYSALADVYDSLMYDVDYDFWASYIGELLKDRGVSGKVADIACGTGNITLRLKKLGFDVTGVDISEEMLACAAEKSRGSGLRINYVRQDMRRLSLFRTSAVVSAMDGVNYLTSDGDAEAFFRSAYMCLKKGGVLLFDVSSAHKLRDVIGGNVFFDDGDDVTYVWQNELLEKTVRMSLVIWKREGELYRRFDEEHTQRIYGEDEIRALLGSAGFSDVRSFGFGTKEPPKPDDMRVQFAAVKTGD